VPKLTIALGNYGTTLALKQGRIRPERIDLDFKEVEPITTAGMRRMVRNLEFDICEMAFTTYLCARAFGKPLTAIPVFLTRNFHHWAAFKNVNAGINQPKDLEGKTVGVNRGYTVTTGLWVRGVMQTEYGVNLDKVTWAATDDEHVAEYRARAPRNVTYAFEGKPIAELLRSGEFAAAIGDIKGDPAIIKPLIPDAKEAGFAYYRKTGIYPINHGLVIKNSVLAENPWVAEELFRAFRAAKESFLPQLEAGKDLTPTDRAAADCRPVVGSDPFPFGVEANRKALDAMVRFAVEQHVIPAPMKVEELFAPNTLKLA
jgi:4,5-dihydroxyphthalate decarboxylase